MYTLFSQFHEMARAISPYGDVVHYGYSMNWFAETCGASMLDFIMFEAYDAVNDIANMALGENFIAERHGAEGRKRGSNSPRGNNCTNYRICSVIMDFEM